MALALALAFGLALQFETPATAQTSDTPPDKAQTVQETVQETVRDTVDSGVAFRRVRADSDLQFDLPGDGVDPVDEEPKPERRRNWGGDVLDAIAPFAKIVLWSSAALVALGIVWFVVQSLRDIRFQERNTRAEGDETAPDLYEPEAQAVRTLLEQVDALAAQGRYRQAVHVLLFRAIEDIDRARPGQVRRSLTSREISRLPAITERTRAAFTEIARINERGWFAGLDTDRAQFEAARAAYAQFDGRQARSTQVQPRLSDGDLSDGGLAT